METSSLEPISRRSDRSTAPLASMQSALWKEFQRDPLDPTWNSGSVIRFKGPLNTAALAAAIKEIARRHDGLRTTIAEADGEPVQIIHEAMHPDMFAELRFEDLAR